MKTILKFSLIPLMAFVLSGCGWMDQGSWINTKTIDPDGVYRVGAKGNDLRVYEWTSPVSGEKFVSVHSDNGKSWGACLTCEK